MYEIVPNTRKEISYPIKLEIKLNPHIIDRIIMENHLHTLKDLRFGELLNIETIRICRQQGLQSSWELKLLKLEEFITTKTKLILLNLLIISIKNNWILF